VLWLYRTMEALHDLEECLGRAVFEIPGLPPSIPGMRLHNLLVAAIEKAGGSVLEGMAVSALTISTNSQRAQLSAVFAPTPKGRGKSIETVWSEAAARCTSHTAHFFILATGGFLGGGITMPGHSDDPYETALGLPILIQENLPRFQPKFLALQGHPIYHTGVQVNSDLQPVDENGLVIYENLYAVGGTLANCDPVRERSLEGIAIATGYTAGQMV
jgi:glycerol-3-phosphate dehydrogenase subunit B